MELFELSRDTDKVNAGVWVTNVKGGADGEFLVLGYTSTAIKRLGIELEAARPDNLEKNPVDFDERTDWEARQKLKAGLLGFRNLTMKGKPWTYVKSEVDAILDDKRFDKFALVISNAMNKADDVKISFEEEAEKNLRDGSAES